MAEPFAPTVAEDQLERLDDEGTRQRYDLLERAESMTGVIALGRGDPDLPTPRHIVEAAKLAIEQGVDQVSDAAGLPRLRRAIAGKLRRENGVVVDPAGGVVVTTGGQEGLFLLVQAILERGDEILVPDPRYTSYDVAIQMAGAKMVSVPTSERDGFDLDPDEVERRITPRTRVLLLITPGNPTAGTITPPNLRRLAEIARKHDLLVISDEIYEKLLYDGAEHLSIGSLPGMAERTITLNGFSKTYCMTGWRVGYVAGPRSVLRRVRRLKELASVCAPVVSQWAGVAALEGPQDVVEEYRRIYQGRRRIMLDVLDRMGFTYGDPRGAFYIFVNASSVGMDSIDLSQKLLEEARVLIFPGTGFGEQWVDYMRVSYLAPEAELAEAMSRIETCLGLEGGNGRRSDVKDIAIAWLDPQSHDEVEFAQGLLPEGFRIVAPSSDDPAERDRLLAGVDAVLTRNVPVGEAVFARAPTVRFVQKYGGREDCLDLGAAEQAGAAVAVMPLRGCIAVAELALTLVLALSKQLVRADAATKDGAYRDLGIEPIRTSERVIAFQWMKLDGLFEVYGKTLGIVGYGEIGTEVSKRARAFGMNVLYTKRDRLPTALEQRLEVVWRDLDGLLGEADVVLLTLPHTAETERLIGERELGLMKPEAYLVNAARGGLVDEEALVRALREKRIAGAGLDVFVDEPVPYDHPLLSLDNVIVTPHIGGGTGGARVKQMTDVLDNIVRFFRDGEALHVLRAEAGGR